MRRELVRLAAERSAAERAHGARLQRLRALRDEYGHPRSVRVALVGCGAAKRDGRHKARDLYTGSLFRAALSHAERTADEVLVLSARHGLVAPVEEIDSYNLSLNSYREREREQWAYRVLCGLAKRFAGLEIELTIYAGAAYADGLERAIRMHRLRPARSTDPAFIGYHVRGCVAPLAGLTLGRRLAWFKVRRQATATEAVAETKRAAGRDLRCRSCKQSRPGVTVAGARCWECTTVADERAAKQAARREAQKLARAERAAKRAAERQARQEHRKAEAAERLRRRLTKDIARAEARRRSEESSRATMAYEAAEQRERARQGRPVGVPVHCGGWVAADGVLYSAAEYGAKEDRAMALRMGWAQSSAGDGATVIGG